MSHACPYCGRKWLVITLHGMNTHIGKKHPDKTLLNQHWRAK